ncbi:MAG: sugar nucleotide-binding protein [Oligoflexia bacterium]|nr:sugar nucleotide-binding protein [Oligoflexia bacterium]
MNIIVIGASGFIGNHIYTMGKNDGHLVLGTTNSKRNIDLVAFNMVSDEIKNILTLNFTTDPANTICIICAAISKIDFCVIDNVYSEKINVHATIRLIEELSSLGIKVVFLSTDYVFDGKDGGYSEEDHVNPITEYGRQKVKIEKFIMDTSSSNLIVRLSKILGDNQDYLHPFSEWYKQITKKETIYCIKDQIFSPTFVGDVYKGIIALINKRCTGVYHLANSEIFSRERLISLFIEKIGMKTEIVEKELKDFYFIDNRTLKSYLNSTKFQNEVGLNFTKMSDIAERFAANAVQLRA